VFGWKIKILVVGLKGLVASRKVTLTQLVGSGQLRVEFCTDDREDRT
jgi:hypothetical protein